MDVFGEIPENLVEKFDVVHIRTFCIVVKNGNPVPLLKNMIELLSEFTICLPSPRVFLVFRCANISRFLKNRADTFNGTRWTVLPLVRIRQTSTLRKRTRTNYYACGSNLPPIPIWSSGKQKSFHGSQSLLTCLNCAAGSLTLTRSWGRMVSISSTRSACQSATNSAKRLQTIS